MVSAMWSKSGPRILASGPAISYSSENSTAQACAERGLKRQAAAKCRNGPFTRRMSMASGGRSSLRVLKVWFRPRIPTLSVASTRSAVRSSTFAARHQGRKRGYDSMSSTSANISPAECSTIADRAIRFMGKSGSNVDRREPQGVPRLFHRGALRGRHRARGLGGEGDPRRPGQHRRGLRHGARRGAVSLRRPREPAAPRAPPPPPAAPPAPPRPRMRLRGAEEIRRLVGKVEQRGYTLVPLNLHYSKGRIKLEVGLGRGKLKHDKRADQREKEWNREKQRLLRSK